MASTIEVFYSYAHEDEKLRNRLEQQLALLQRSGQITNWHDRKISPGRDWANEIDTNLNKAQIILLLISPAFLSSDYCYGIEMKRALEKHERGEALVIPIILRPVHWEDAPFGKLQALPVEGNPVTSRSWHNLDEAFFDIARGIRKAVKELISSSENVSSRMIDKQKVVETNKYLGDTHKEEPLNGRKQVPNPYYDYTSIRDLSMLFGRENELQVLFNAIDKRNCLSIVGTRRIGKSSLLKHLAAIEVQHRYGYNLNDRIFILLDASDYLHKTREDFYHLVCEQIISQCWQFHLTLTSHTWAEHKLKKLLEDIRRSGFRPVLLIDEVDNFALNPHFDPAFFSYLRALAGIYDLVSFITASIRPLYEVLHTDAIASSPFFNIFLTLSLGPLLPDEARQIITVPSSSAGHPFTEEEIEWLLKQAGRHPFFIQILCRLLFEEKVRPLNANLDLQDIRDRAYAELTPHFEDIWRNLNDEQQKDLLIESAPWTSSLRKKMPELSESKLFSGWLISKRPSTPLFTTKEVKDALDNIDDITSLGTCSLSELRYIQMRKQSQVGKPKGKLVRDLLKEAFTQMRPKGELNDKSPDWRLYNILYYCYFGKHFQSQQIAARLGITSKRQYYRQKDQAIQVLHQILLEIERASENDFFSQL